MSVLIFGGTGSLGVALLEHFYAVGEKVIIVSRDEQKQFILKEKYPKATFLLGDIRSRNDLHDIFIDTMGLNTSVEVAINTAALKHVAIGEYNPYQSVQTNIIGAKNIIDVCCEFKVPTCVFVSTDKAVQPVNLYGMCKAVAERLFIQANQRGITKFVGVRYGNVLNSNGSLIPFYQRLAQDPHEIKLPLTSRDMTRFFITLQQAVNLIDIARAYGTPAGTITIPRLFSMRIEDIAELFAEKYKMFVEVTGVKPGEKIDEILLTPEEIKRTVDKDGFFRLYDKTMLSELSQDDGKELVISSYASCDHLLYKSAVKDMLMREGLL